MTSCVPVETATTDHAASVYIRKPEIFGDDVRTRLLRMQPEDGQMNETNTVRLVMKFFTHKEHAESFLDGQMRAGRLHVLRALEDRVRRDSDEGQFVAKVPKEDGPVWIGTTRLDGIFLVDDDIELEVGTRLPKNMQRLRGAVIWSVPAIDHCSVLCLSQPSRADLRAFVDSNSMGDHAVAIHNPRELVQRVGSAAVTRGYEVWHGPVKYYDEKPDSANEKGIKIDVAFQKLRKHEREQEYRILINTNTAGDDCLRLDVGSIRDIARYITPQDLANLQPSAAP